MKKIAIITAFSESALPLVKQFIVSCYQCIKKYTDPVEFCFYVYECNWTATKKIFPFKQKINLAEELPIGVPIIQKDASIIKNEYTILPDITAYHDFAINYLDNFDYALFCHDDVVVNESINLFNIMAAEIRNPLYNILAEAHLQCQYYISARFYPHFIFVKTDKFRMSNLSFCNDLTLINHDEFRVYKLNEDGGAGLLNSYYSRNNPMKDCVPLSPPRHWYRHLRFGTVNGIETYNIAHPNSPVFLEMCQKAEEYCDLRLYG